MRISDWSSDVCASDLEQGARVALVAVRLRAVDQRSPVARGLRHVGLGLVAEMAEAAGELQAVGGVPGQTAVDRGLPGDLVLAGVEVEIGRASGRERVGKEGWVQGVAGSMKKKK